MENTIQRSPQSRKSDATPESWTNLLFVRFASLYGARFTSTINTDEQRQDWKHAWALVLFGLTAKQIKSALEVCTLKHDWPPTPSEFREICIPRIDYEGLFVKTVNALSTEQWPDKITFWAAQAFGRYDLRTASYSQAKARWITVVDATVANLNLAEVPEPKLGLPEPGQTSNKAVAETAIGEVRKVLGAKDYRKWAREPRSHTAVDLMFSGPPMVEEIEIATQNGFIRDGRWVPPGQRAAERKEAA